MNDNPMSLLQERHKTIPYAEEYIIPEKMMITKEISYHDCSSTERLPETLAISLCIPTSQINLISVFPNLHMG
jgi:hypothetical protein